LFLARNDAFTMITMCFNQAWYISETSWKSIFSSN